MAKNLSFVCFTVLLLVLIVASTEILKSEAACPHFIGECGPEPYTGSNAECKTSCQLKFGVPPVCNGFVELEGGVAHCHCYGYQLEGKPHIVTI